MIATTLEFMELYEEAMNFKKLAQENVIKPGQVIVIQDPETGILGFCSIDKDSQLSVHLGNEGLSGYLETLYFPDSYLLSRQTCLTLAFTDRQELDVWDCNQLEKLDLNLNNNDTWPKFRSFLAGFLPDPLKEGWECRFLTQAIKQLIEIGTHLKEDENTFNLIGDEVIFCSHADNGEWNTIKVPLSVFLEQMTNEKVAYKNELEAYRINRLPSMNMTFEMTQFFLPYPVKKSKESRGFFPMVTAVFESGTKYLVFAEITDSGKDSQEMVVKNFASTLLNDLQFKPRRIATDNENVFTWFEDFCTKTNIELETVSKLEAAEELMADLINDEDKALGAMATNKGFEEEIDVILDTANGICKTILNSNLLNSTLAEEAKHKFTSIIELIHVVMLGNFKELPDSWTANNMEIAYKDILPTLLSEDELQHVPDIIYNYVDIVGEAEILPNYREIKHRMQLIKG